MAYQVKQKQVIRMSEQRPPKRPGRNGCWELLSCLILYNWPGLQALSSPSTLSGVWFLGLKKKPNILFKEGPGFLFSMKHFEEVLLWAFILSCITSVRRGKEGGSQINSPGTPPQWVQNSALNVEGLGPGPATPLDVPIRKKTGLNTYISIQLWHLDSRTSD